MQSVLFKEKRVLHVLGILLGTFSYAVGIYCFIEPGNIAPGGASGIAIMLNYLFHLPVGLMSFVINIPILIVGWRGLGKKVIFKTLLTLILNTILLDIIIPRFFPIYQGDRLLCALFGGILMGAGLAVVFLCGSTTGGTDILSHLVQRRFPHIPIGRAILFIDCIILTISIFVFGDIEAALYGLISLFCCTKTIDTILFGFERGGVVMVISKNTKELAPAVMKDLSRGATILKGTGAYTNTERDVLLCAVRRHQFSRLKSIVRSIDPGAFLIVLETGDIMGEGFKPVH